VTLSESLATATRLHQAGRLHDAKQAYRQILAINSNHSDAWHLLGVIAIQQGDTQEAVRCIERALELKPDFAEAQSDLGAAFFEQGDLDRAVACHRRATELNPGYAGAYINLGNTYRAQSEFESAITSYRRALEINPTGAEVHCSLGIALRSLGKLEEAIAEYRQAIQLMPGHVRAHNNLGNLLRSQGRFDNAVACYRRALDLKPDYADAHFNLSIVLLTLADFQHGWPEFEFRFARSGASRRQFSEPTWDGRDVRGKTILLYAEQGLGDTIQFVRYARLVQQRGARVLLECQKELVPLLTACPGVDCLSADHANLSFFDMRAPLLSLPRIFQTTLASIPAEIPYLFAEPRLVDQWKENLNPVHGMRIGIAWQGNPEYRDDRERSIPLAYFLRLAQIPGVCLISLQIGPGAEQLAASSNDVSVVSPGEDFDRASGAFMDTAAIMQHLDLVITSDSAIAHLAGALGRPVWLAVPFVPDWRWLLDREDSPWYPTMRLFRQSTPGDWHAVFDHIQRALQSTAGKQLDQSW
jgi:tetratricopeptide (TPR) repeat protein